MLLMAGAAVLSFSWWSQSQEGALRLQRYRAAMVELSQLRFERKRIHDDLARNQRLIAWRQTRIDEARNSGGPVELAGQQSPSDSTDSSDPMADDVSDYLEVSLAEDEFNLGVSNSRRADLEAEKRVIEEKIAMQEACVRGVFNTRAME